MAPNVAHGCQNVGIPFSRHDSPNDLQASDATDIADDMVQLKVHQRQGLLHVLHVCCRVLEVSVPDPHVGAQRRDVPARMEARPQQPTRVQALQLLGVVDIAFAPRNRLAITGVGKHNVQAMLFKDLVDRNPVHTGGFHRHGRDAD